ncbi:hypothetical protein BDB00DRAFT_97231 [Zychaea mexicana]|uniref:uncharacterized protein n=1 Tax=Zychaea mexicana TaxID=64656 RepID=UPI0022FE7120|nr:uncharacterized protein BDB00DRAFT_97231 [Zychaea mexicana]KAI9496577.1 hypothetical protein BDB00DRAFT_97231 [Zychaea mexicana]
MTKTTIKLENAEKATTLFTRNTSSVSSLRCATCDEPITAKVQHGLCRSCYKKDYQINYRQSKRNATEIDDTPEDTAVLPNHKRATYDLLNDNIIQLLNGDWRFQPCLRFAALWLLAGCLLVDDPQLLYVNCVEPYNRLPTLDAHFEHFSVVHLPPSRFRVLSVPQVGLMLF